MDRLCRHSLAAFGIAALLLGAETGSGTAARAGEPVVLEYALGSGHPLAPEWKLIGGKWVVESDGLRQVAPGADDPTKALLVVGERYAGAHGDAVARITAELRVDAWEGREYSRAGVSLASDPETGRGVNLVLYAGRLTFVNDFVAWGASCGFPIEVGRWCTIRLERSDDRWKGKAWLEGQPEPDGWMVEWSDGAVAPRGYPALVGGSGGLASERSAVTFRRCEIDWRVWTEAEKRTRDMERRIARWNAGGPRSLRRAVDDLTRSFGDRYPNGRRYSERLAAIEAEVASADGSNGAERHTERLFAAIEAFDTLRDDALLANPLLDFDRLLLVDRRDARDYQPAPSFPIPPFAGRDHVLNGLPNNYQGNAVLREVPIENRIAVLSPVGRKGTLSTLFQPESPGYVGELDLHFGAERLLYSGLDGGRRFQIYELGFEGGGPRQITGPVLRDEGITGVVLDDVDNYDACYLADDRVLFGSSACFQSVPCERRWDEVANLFVVNPDGSNMRRLCFDQDHDFYPTMMADGRILYLRWEYTDIAHAFSARLFTMNPDGTGQRAFYGSGGYWPNRIFYAKPIPGRPTQFVGVVTGHHGTPRAGELILFDAAVGRKQADGALQRIPGHGRTVEPILKDALVDGSWPKFLHPYPLSDSYFLVSCQPSAESPWGVYLADRFDNLVLLHEIPGRMLLEPIPVRATPRPPVIPDRTAPETREATVTINDVYSGEGLVGVPRGSVKRLRVYSYHFNYYGTSGIEDYVGMDGPWDVRRILGTVPVHEDGSVHFVVPANTPIALQPLDSEGKALQLMRSWFTAMPGETVSCVGCHDYTGSAPAKRLGAALERAPSRIEPWYGPPRGFSWEREVQPVLDTHCAACHDGAARDGRALADLRSAEPRRLPLSDAPFPPSFYELRRFVRSPGLEGDPRVLPPAEYHADTNPLVQMLRKGHHGVVLDTESWDRIVTWIDLNAPAYGGWQEIPGVRENEAVSRCRDQRIESQRRFAGLDEDPEQLAPVPPRGAPRLPEPLPRSEPIDVAGWPFGPDEAADRQRAAVLERKSGQGDLDRTAHERDIDLGDGVTLRLVLIPAGSFVMGNAEGFADERPARRAAIDKPFWIGRFEVTNAQFTRFDPSHDSGREPMPWLKWDWEDFLELNEPNQPVCRVSWHEADAFCRWLSRRTGRAFSLPTETQWEWACRAGAATDMHHGARDADFSRFANLADSALLNLAGWNRVNTGFSRVERVRAFYASDSHDDRHQVAAPVGSFEPNAWGLRDMHGNVAEWTSSAYGEAKDDNRGAGSQPNASDYRGASFRLAQSEPMTVRGGSWYSRADLAGSASRTGYRPWQRVFDVGFRVVCEAE
ncbi:MAG: formylglycine-generating enzyme family protein [Planctomycetes bacterium]|nr:formylglycine-generating enzyme family protein [Planctomycetota bacterium]